MKKNKLWIVGLVLCLSQIWVAPAFANAVDQQVMHIPIPLLDEQGEHVLASSKPYSPRTSCGTAGCHDYDAITEAYHFETGRDEAHDDYGEKIGLPQLVSSGYFGGYNCMGGNNPDLLAKKNNATEADFGDLGSPGYIQYCISCHAGGGWMEKDREGRRYDSVDPASVTALDGDYFTRGTGQTYPPADPETVSQWDWRKSGVVENDCLLCHVDFKQLKIFDPSLQVEGGPDAQSLFTTLRNTKLVRGGHFRYADSAILEYLNLNTDSSRETDQAMMAFAKENLQATESHGSVSVEYDLKLGLDGAPQMVWNPGVFDERGKVEIPMLSFPANDNCMTCHRTGNSRRGFYGFGEDAAATFDEEGMIKEDYKDDVHYGLTWTEANGESRDILSCNACHARDYYRKAYENIDLNANHEFLKGNSDINVHDDKDFRPNAKSCIYCHDDAEQPAIPSGHDSMLAAHMERWRSGGDLRGYPSSAIERITQVHLDVVSCQTCHITDKVYRGKPLQISYRYRREEDKQLRITPNYPRARYFWKDKNSGRVLTKTERDSVYRMKFDDEGKRYGEIFDPETGDSLARVQMYMSHGSWRYREVETYDDFVSLKLAFDKVLYLKGVENADTALVWTEINNYLMSHNTRPAVSSLQCSNCHNQKQNGTYSSFISPDGILGESNMREVTRLIDKRLVDEGLVILELPYMQVDAEGLVTENVSDILYYTLVNPSMTRLNNELAPFQQVDARRRSIEEGLKDLGMESPATKAVFGNLFGGEQAMFLYQPNYGLAPVRSAAVMVGANRMSELFMPYSSFRISLAGEKTESLISSSGRSQVTTDPLKVELVNTSGDLFTSFFDREFVVRLAYRGQAPLNELKVMHSSDGDTWSVLPQDALILHQPASDYQLGYVVFSTPELGYLAVVDDRGPVIGSCLEPDACSL